MDTLYITFENFWGEELRFVNIFHSHIPLDIIPLGNEEGPWTKIRHIQDKEIQTDVIDELYFPEKTSYWRIKFVTMYGQLWWCDGKFSCNIKPEDNHRITLGVNGESKRLYAAFPVSSPCSTSLRNSYF